MCCPDVSFWQVSLLIPLLSTRRGVIFMCRLGVFFWWVVSMCCIGILSWYVVLLYCFDVSHWYVMIMYCIYVLFGYVVFMWCLDVLRKTKLQIGAPKTPHMECLRTERLQNIKTRHTVTSSSNPSLSWNENILATHDNGFAVLFSCVFLMRCLGVLETLPKTLLILRIRCQH